MVVQLDTSLVIDNTKNTKAMDNLHCYTTTKHHLEQSQW